jgi:hypothetical protein
MSLAITTHRLLIFKFGNGRSADPKDLLTNIPLGEVDSIVVGETRTVTKPVTLTVKGQPYALEVRRAVDTSFMATALQQAKSGLRAAG